MWPLEVDLVARKAIADAGGSTVFERHLKWNEPFDPNIVDEIAKTRPDIVFTALAGQDAVDFHRAFAEAGLDRTAFRFSEMVEENTLLGCGAAATNRLISIGPYFATLPEDKHLSFLEDYQVMHGAAGPAINMFAQSLYEGVQFYGSLVERNKLEARGPVAFRSARGGIFHSNCWKEDPVYLAEADGLNFRVVEQLSGAT